MRAVRSVIAAAANTAGNVIQASATHCFFVVNKIRIIFAATMVQEGIIAKGNTETAASREAHISRCVSACCPPPATAVAHSN